MEISLKTIKPNTKNPRYISEDNFEKLKDYKFVMIEGGKGMLKSCKDSVKNYLIYKSPHEKKGVPVEFDIDIKESFSSTIGEDTYSWYIKCG